MKQIIAQVLVVFALVAGFNTSAYAQTRTNNNYFSEDVFEADTTQVAAGVVAGFDDEGHPLYNAIPEDSEWVCPICGHTHVQHVATSKMVWYNGKNYILYQCAHCQGEHICYGVWDGQEMAANIPVGDCPSLFLILITLAFGIAVKIRSDKDKA